MSALRHFVLDEADQMLSKGFLDQIQDTFEFVPRDTQVYFSSMGHQSKYSPPKFVCKFNIFGSHCRSYWSPRHSHQKCWTSPASLWGTRGGCWSRGKNSPCKASSSSTSTWKERYTWSIYWIYSLNCLFKQEIVLKQKQYYGALKVKSKQFGYVYIKSSVVVFIHDRTGNWIPCVIFTIR